MTSSSYRSKKIDIPADVKFLLNQLLENGYESFIVGGCVRDSLLDITPKDYDITTNATPEKLIKIFEKLQLIDTGLKHGTLTVVLNNQNYEITTYRIDGEYKDNRHPNNIEYTFNLRQDLSRRDFTINALVCDINGNVKDYFFGIDDLSKKLVRCIGSPSKRFFEDSLRILRALRFASVLNFKIDDSTSQEIHNLKDLLKNISQERISSEFNKLICGVNSKLILTEYRDVLSVCIPEIISSFDFNQNNKYHINDVYNHSVNVVNNYHGNSLIIKLACFFHDIGKPFCYTEEKDEKGNIQGHFYNHYNISAELTYKILKRMKYSNEIINKVCLLIKYHDIESINSKKVIKRLLNKFNNSFELIECLIDLKNADRMDHLGPYNLIDKKEIIKIVEEIKEKEESFSLKTLAINGNDLIDIGINPSPLMKKILNDCLDQTINGVLENTKNILISYVESKYKYNI